MRPAVHDAVLTDKVAGYRVVIVGAVYRPVKAGLDLLTGMITRRSEARVKLH